MLNESENDSLLHNDFGWTQLRLFPDWYPVAKRSNRVKIKLTSSVVQVHAFHEESARACEFTMQAYAFVYRQEEVVLLLPSWDKLPSTRKITSLLSPGLAGVAALC